MNQTFNKSDSDDKTVVKLQKKLMKKKNVGNHKCNMCKIDTNVKISL